MATAEPSIRVTVVQPALAKYRIAVFRELASRPGIDLRLVYGSTRGLPNVDPEGFAAIQSHRWEGTVLGRQLMFQGAEWTNCTRQLADVLVLRWSPSSMTLIPALLRARASGIPTVLWGHGYSKNKRGRRHSARKWLARLAPAVVFYEPQTRESFIQDGWDAKQLFVALNSLENIEIEHARTWWQDRPDQLAQFRREMGLDTGPVVLFVSRLHPANRVDLLIEAMGLLAKEIPGLKTVIIGNGTEERQQLRSLAAEVGAADNVVFQDGVYDEQKLAPWFLSADVFCYPSNIGLSLIHALWYGLPVVTTDNLDIQNPEIVALENGVNGLTYEHGSVASLAEALRQLVTNDALRKSMSRAARATVEDRFTIPRMVDGLEAAIRYAYETSTTAHTKSHP